MALFALDLLREFPNEIFIEIFKSTAWSDRELLSLLHVCRTWRRLVEGCPILWSKIHVDYQQYQFMERAVYWLGRSRNSPLSVELHFPRGIKGDSFAHLTHLFHEAMHHWASLHINAPIRLVRQFFKICAGPTPILQSLTIDTGEFLSMNEETPSPIMVIPFPSSVPSQISITLRDIIPVFSPSFGSSITHIHMQIRCPGTGTRIISIFESCPNLTRFELEALPSGEVERPGFAHIVPLPHLKYLSFIFILDVENILPWLGLPALETLKLSFYNWSNVLSVCLWDILRRCPSISTFDIAHDDDWPEEWSDAQTISTMAHPLTLPSLTYLSACQEPVHPLLQLLTLPNAQEIVMREVSFDALQRLVTSSTQLNTLFVDQIQAAPETYSEMSLSTLRSIEIQNSERFLDHLVAPSLQKLSAYGFQHRDSCNLGSLRGFVERSAPPLVSLELFYVKITDEELIECFEGLALLESLRMVGCPNISDAIFHALATSPFESERTNWLLPQLRTLCIFENSKITPSGFIQLLRSRNGEGTSTSSSPPRIEGGVGFSCIPRMTELEHTTINVSYQTSVNVQHLLTLSQSYGSFPGLRHHGVAMGNGGEEPTSEIFED